MLKRARQRALGLGLLVCVVCFLLPGQATRAQPSQSEQNEDESASVVLPELPEVPNTGFKRPTEEAMDALREHLERVRSADPVVRERAVREVLEAQPAWVPAIYHHLNKLADDADRGAMKEKLRKIRDHARDAIRQEMRRASESGKVVTPDYLQMVAQDADPKDEAWRALISVLAMSRMLVAVGTTDAARALIQIFIRFGEFLRVDTQLQLSAMGERSAPALIEARKHPAAKIGSWADRQLDQMGKAIASELVQTEDQQVLADALRAYGRIQDPDAARIIISFANSERAQIRLAARQGVRMMGEVGNWQLRETYQNIVGKTPPRDWSWRRTARELFHEFDRLRLARVHELFETGKAAQRKGDWEAMRKAFDSVLSNNPMFEQREAMVDGYLTYARKAGAGELARALLAVRRAERINGDIKRQPTLESLRLTLEGEQLLEQGIADQTLFRRALELDPENQRAREGLASIERGERVQRPEYSRYYGAGAIGAVALVAILLILLWRPRSDRRTLDDAHHEDEPQAPAAESPGQPEPVEDETKRPPQPAEGAEPSPSAAAEPDADAAAMPCEEASASNAPSTSAQPEAGEPQEPIASNGEGTPTPS